ncbi:monooxygenase [Nonomuraea sp. NN258]|uniref:FAD-dependent monooxygenase n=1 Tax=Nonomuraea antri TaxID=2730852 RepID=UPI001568A01F|nr:FAD-dependent monooxygenase [Nonomuraea antri]NRQ38915.1 monooxygenase [Nonomuraea antri]
MTVIYDAAERLGILPDLAERHIAPDRMLYVKRDSSTRFTLPGQTVRAMLGERAINLLRGDIEDVLYQRVRDHAEIRFGTTLTAVTQDDLDVRVTLSDGTVETADLLVGADGLHSKVRALAFGPESDYRLDLDHMVAVFMMDQRPAVVPEGASATLTATGRTLAVIDLGHGQAGAFFGYRTDNVARELADGPQIALPRVYGDIGWAAPEALRQLPGDESVYFDSISQMVLPRWSQGRIVLLGDAAWCVSLFAGYGSSLAVGGADLLGDMLAAHVDDVPAALAACEAQLQPEAERKQRLGRRVKGLYAPADPFRLWLRDLPLRMASWTPVGRLIERRLQLKG